MNSPIDTTSASASALEAENRELRERLRALELQLAESEERYRALTTGVQVGIIIQGPKAEILFANEVARAILARPPEQVKGVTSYDPSWDAVRDDGTPFPASERPVARVLATGEPVRSVVIGLARPGRADRAWILASATPQFDASGALKQVIATFTDISAQKAAEQRARSQADTILALSTPLIPIAAGVLVLPIIGALDQARVGRVLERLLHGVVERRAQIALLDLTGLVAPDAEAVAGLVGVAKAVRLLGARVVLTGMRPEVARSLVELDIEIGGITIEATLERAVERALRARAEPRA